MGKNKTKHVAPPDATTLSEKRRFAAKISWLKRRTGGGAVNASASHATAAGGAKRKSSSAAAAVSPDKLKRISRMQNKQPSASAPAATLPPSKRRKAEALTAVEIRRNAAILGWERRKRILAASDDNAGSSNADDASSADSETSVDNASNMTKMAAMKKRKMNALAIRRDAAKRGWERRRALLAAEASDDDSSDEEMSSDEGTTKKTASTSRKIYTASDRAKAARLGWEKRKALLAGLPFDESAFSETMPTMPDMTPEINNPRQGTKRSRRLADDSTGTTYEDDAKKINQLVSYLKMSRGWMEFRPSSRRGNGTATYGYIPSSIASFIRDGTLSKRTVLNHGTLGVHYALDWDDYGGLKAMIATFGEDYSPPPTEEMMEHANMTADEWELGEDLPWKEINEAEEKELAARKRELDAIDEDILLVASILANLDHIAANECNQLDLEVNKSIEEDLSDLALNGTRHKAPEGASLSDKRRFAAKISWEKRRKSSVGANNRSASPALTHPVKSPSSRVFSNWHFGLC
jgi:hypothetical protein